MPKHWTPVFTGEATFYETIIDDELVKNRLDCHCEEWSDEAIPPNGK